MGVKISELPAASTLAGTESLPLIQATETRKATVAEIAPVRSVAGKTGAVTLAAANVTGLQTALDAKLSISSTRFPFYDSAGTLDAISLNTDGSFPFFNSTGAADNIPMVT